MGDRDLEYVGNIIGYCDKVENILNEFDSSYEEFIVNDIFQLSCSMCIIQIGENVDRLSDKFKEDYNHIPWRSIKDMRNIITHKYESAEFEVMWYALTVEVPELKEELVELKLLNS